MNTRQLYSTPEGEHSVHKRKQEQARATQARSWYMSREVAASAWILNRA
jgi:hypothetical protein